MALTPGRVLVNLPRCCPYTIRRRRLVLILVTHAGSRTCLSGLSCDIWIRVVLISRELDNRSLLLEEEVINVARKESKRMENCENDNRDLLDEFLVSKRLTS